ncbi:MAG: 2-thiouracil desulfurase family protein [Candidatus Bathyarchaeia archaeon]
MKDRRSRRLALVAHCLLNQNSRASGLAERSSVVAEFLEFFMRHEIGIIQMPCPELAYAGVMRQPQTKEYYDNAFYRGYCRKIAEELANQVQEYENCGIKLKLVIGVNGSPSCGLNETMGIFMEELRSALAERQISTPFHGVRYGRIKEDIAQLEKLIKTEFKLEA